MGRTLEKVNVPLTPERAFELWTDVRRWSGFVEGFARVREATGEWPAVGSQVVWESIPSGRGRVTERVTAVDSGRAVSSQVFEEALTGTQTVTFEEGEDGALVKLELRYELTRTGPLRAVADVLFIRRALGDAQRRTLSRFGIEADEEAEL